jgi:hypothetical protein
VHASFFNNRSALCGLRIDVKLELILWPEAEIFVERRP